MSIYEIMRWKASGGVKAWRHSKKENKNTTAVQNMLDKVVIK